MRVAVSLLIAAVLLVGALFLFGVLPPGKRALAEPDLFELLGGGEIAAALERVEAGADVNFRDADGQTPLMAALRAGADVEALAHLLAAGADVNARTPAGLSALGVAATEGTPAQVVYLLNAGADPTSKDSAGRTPAELAQSNSAVRASGVYPRLLELSEGEFRVGWPSAYLVPVEGATISSRRNHLPGAPRPYRNGTHEGFDFYAGTVSVNIAYGTPVSAVADGVVIRADHGYVEHTLTEYEELIATAARSLDTPPEVLDGLRGRQVWLEHAGGFVSRYAHLAAVAEGVTVGAHVKQGEVIGTTGNSGTIEAAEGTQDDPHPHVEIWRGDDTYLGAGLEPEETWALAGQVFGSAALPPYHD